MFVNASDTGENTSGFDFVHSTPPVSPLRQHDLYTIFGGDVNFGDFTFSPFDIRG